MDTSNPTNINNSLLNLFVSDLPIYTSSHIYINYTMYLLFILSPIVYSYTHTLLSNYPSIQRLLLHTMSPSHSSTVILPVNITTIHVL